MINGGNITIDDNDEKHERNKRSMTTLERASRAFQNGFLQYSNYKMISMPSNESTNERITLTSLSSFIDDKPTSNIQMVPKRNESEENSIEFDYDEIDSMHQSNQESAESFGFLVLEMFGTVVGLTWGAISQVHNFLTNGNNGNTNTSIVST